MNRIRCFPTIEQHHMLRLVAETGLCARVENGHVVLTDGNAAIFGSDAEKPHRPKVLRFQRRMP